MPDQIQRHILHLPKGKRHKVKGPNRQATRAYHTGSKGWEILRTRILVRDLYTCKLCGHMDPSNHVDHEDGNSWNNDEANLRVLCQRCHSSHGMQPDRNPRIGVGSDGWPVG
jgi:5-methylcytosine-specific restriction endonuclease McrA